jgi:hypothetical protein
MLRYNPSVLSYPNSLGKLTKMIYNMGFTPLRAMRSRPLSTNTSQSRIKQQVINLVSPNFIKGLFRKRLDTLQIIQLQRKNSYTVRFTIEF